MFRGVLDSKSEFAMKRLLDISKRRLFPCPICGEGLDVRESKKGKTYVVCQSCSMQMFTRAEPGIRKFEELVEAAETENIWQRILGLEEHYKRKCSKCDKSFWLTEELIRTSWFDGSFVGYRCPEPDCDGIVPPEENK
jgi:ssDNA-binding Zn-finger/Zn-ribbon topoisomerase 1